MKERYLIWYIIFAISKNIIDSYFQGTERKSIKFPFWITCSLHNTLDLKHKTNSKYRSEFLDKERVNARLRWRFYLHLTASIEVKGFSGHPSPLQGLTSIADLALL